MMNFNKCFHNDEEYYCWAGTVRAVRMDLPFLRSSACLVTADGIEKEIAKKKKYQKVVCRKNAKIAFVYKQRVVCVLSLFFGNFKTWVSRLIVTM